MDPSYYYAPAWRRRQQAARAPEPLAESGPAPARLLQEAATSVPSPGGAVAAPEPDRPAGRTVGFWALPGHGDGPYLKLRIAAHYGDVPGFDPKAPWPVVAVARNRRILLPTFPWLEPHLEGWEAPEGAEKLARQLRRRGWRFVAVHGTTLYYSGEADDPVLPAIVAELAGGAVQRPATVKLDLSRVTHLKFLHPGGHVSGTLDRARMLALGTGEEGAEAAKPLEDRLAAAADSREPWRALALLLREVADASELDALDPALLAKILAPEAVRRDMRQALDGLGAGGVTRLRGTVLRHLQLEAAAGRPVPTGYPDQLQLPVQESLTERSYFELWNLTRENGGYKYGGLRRVGGRWVYDALVRGRSTNGARFVIANPPKPYRDEDGRIVLRFQYQSRPSRSTTGMMQVGYVKFKDHEAFLKASARNLPAALKHGDVQVSCSCPDHLYRWQWVLAGAGAAPAPIGAANTPPDQTNPKRLLGMCKHLSAVSPFMLTRPTGAFDHDLRRLLKLTRAAATEPAPDGGAPVVRGGAELDSDASPEPEEEPPEVDDAPETGR